MHQSHVHDERDLEEETTKSKKIEIGRRSRKCHNGSVGGSVRQVPILLFYNIMSGYKKNNKNIRGPDNPHNGQIISIRHVRAYEVPCSGDDGASFEMVLY